MAFCAPSTGGFVAEFFDVELLRVFREPAGEPRVDTLRP